MPKALVVMGSRSDWDTVQKTCDILDEFGVGYERVVCSAHRNPEKLYQIASAAESEGYEVVVAAAGMAAALPGVIAGLTPLPVIGIPCKSANLEGLDALLSIAQMPPGVPVAAVAIDGAKNAGILAVQILSVKYPELRQKMIEYKNSLKQ
ncbi:MAG: 5-(carboxyamino)imidazole ribonucleotide mutase [Abditibacteriota bacterium]|nr:5-(carboxyamino)imidazole ribonucleotide mutase [Abditibacteriota bacterium]